jgi:hypothetical protein
VHFFTWPGWRWCRRSVRGVAGQPETPCCLTGRGTCTIRRVSVTYVRTCCLISTVPHGTTHTPTVTVWRSIGTALQQYVGYRPPSNLERTIGRRSPGTVAVITRTRTSQLWRTSSLHWFVRSFGEDSHHRHALAHTLLVTYLIKSKNVRKNKNVFITKSLHGKCEHAADCSRILVAGAPI